MVHERRSEINLQAFYLQIDEAAALLLRGLYLYGISGVNGIRGSLTT